MDEDAWPEILPMVEFVLNHTPRRNLAGFAPITVFTNLQPESPLDSLLDTFTPPANLPTDAAAIRSRIIHLQQTVAEMHKHVSATRDNRRNRSRQAHNSQTPNFSEGDFVLFGVRDDSNRARRSKLSVRWTGPYRISAVLSDWHYQLQNIVSADTVEAHVTRIKFYHDSSLNVTEELKAFASSNMRFIVNSLLNARLDHSQWQLLVQLGRLP